MYAICEIVSAPNYHARQSDHQPVLRIS